MQSAFLAQCMTMAMEWSKTVKMQENFILVLQKNATLNHNKTTSAFSTSLERALSGTTVQQDIISCLQLSKETLELKWH
jgi:hypothetical protein